MLVTPNSPLPPYLSVLAAPISHAGRAPSVLFRPTIFTRQFRPALLAALGFSSNISPHHLAINVGLASRSNSQRASRPACLASPILPRTYSGRDARSRPPHPSVVLISFIPNTAGAYTARDNARRHYGAGLLGGPRARGGGWGVGANVLMWQRTKTGM